MKRGKDEKLMGPMFPRLHVNDADKGGPRAPPRNKMALYEQLSIPSQRFGNSDLPQTNSSATNSFPQPSQVPPSHEKQYNQNSEFGDHLVQVKERKKLDEDDYRVPVFHSTSSQGFDKVGAMDRGRQSASNSRYINTRKEDNINKRQRSEGFAVGYTDDVSPSSSIEGLNMPTGSCIHPEQGDNTPTNSPTLKKNGIGNSVLVENVVTNMEKNSSFSGKVLPSKNQNYIPGISNDISSVEDRACKSLQTGNLERGDSVSETSILEIESGVDNITPDNVIALIGQKHFWKARGAIANQQRIFGIQMFELHRLIKVQRLIAASPNLLLEDAAVFLSKSAKKLPMNSPIKPTPNVSKQRVEPEQQQELISDSADNTPERASVLVAPITSHQPSNCKPFSGSSTGSAASNSFCFNQLQGHQLLIPVISPSEGLIYKPYPGPGYPDQACGGYAGPQGSNLNMGNFLAPVYGIPALSHCPVPFPPIGPPYGYFSTYGMPIMKAPAMSNSSVDQTNPSLNMFTVPAREKIGPVSECRPWEDNEVQGSTASSPCDRGGISRRSSAMEAANMLPIIHGITAVNAWNTEHRTFELGQPIKVVPRNGVSASESAARIFRSIQEERKQHDSM